MAGAIELRELAECEFRAMGTEAHILVLDGDDADLHWARNEVERLEAKWSRFRDDSEAAQINRSAGRWVEVSSETLALAFAARRAWVTTGGAFDPLLGIDLRRLGYDRTFAEIDGRDAGDDSEGQPRPARAASDLEIDDRAGTVRVAPGTAIDFGGIAKGWTADRLVAGLLDRGVGGACANLGGDLAVGGQAPDVAGWVVDVSPEAATRPRSGTLALRTGGVATSTTLRRCWRGPGGDLRHHLLDPLTGASCAGALVEVTVVAATASAAEVLTKVAFAAPERLAAAIGAARAGAILTYGDGATAEVGIVPWLRRDMDRGASGAG